LFIPVYLRAQIREPKSIVIRKTSEVIVIDGELNEQVWKNADKATNFYQNFPYDTGFALSQTEVMLTYNNDYLYVAAKCYDTISNFDYVVTSLKRDWSYPISDAFVVTLDPFNDKTNGFSFGVNPWGVQREGLIANGGIMGVSTDWDNKWFSEVKCNKDFWSVEMAIPFKTLRYKTSVNTWGINFSRNDLKRNENSCWNYVPRQFNISTLTYTGNLIWETPPPHPGHNLAFIPYLTGGANTDNTKNVVTINQVFNVGLDAKVAITPSLNLDLTLNPDFSQVEVDRQQTNLTRFSLFFPERRNFFIENSDLFARFGFSTIRPFFSRRIGLDKGNIIPIIAGGRLSGKINRNWRIGLMNIQTQYKSIGSDTILPNNYSVVALQRQIKVKSNFGFIIVNRHAFNTIKPVVNNFNRVAGFDYNHVSNNNKLLGKIFYHYAFTPQLKNDAYAHAVWINYNEKNYQVEYNHEVVGSNYIADVGFVPRLYNYDPINKRTVTIGFIRYEDYALYRFFPKNSRINNHGPGLYFNQYSTLDFKPNDRIINPNYQITFQNQSNIKFNTNFLFTKLFFDTDVTQSGSSTLLNAGNYYYKNISTEYNSSPINKLNGNLSLTYGEFYIGKISSINSTVNYRLQPYGNISINYSYNLIDMPVNYNSAHLHLLGTRVEITFTKSVFFTTFLQYNTQINNFNINTRLQWRFKPMSDLFIVYAENYDTANIKIKNRAIILKLIYWFNV
jgi:hypothetical protein